MTALPGETPGTGGTDTPQDAVSPPDEAGAQEPGAPEPEADAEAANDGAAEASPVGAEDEAGAEGEAVDPASTEAGAAEASPAPELSEAQAELAAQRELRERIEQRKAAKAAPIAAGAGLSGTAADLLAAVRAVESGEKAGSAFFGQPAAPQAPQPAPSFGAPSAPTPPPAPQQPVHSAPTIAAPLAPQAPQAPVAPQAPQAPSPYGQPQQPQFGQVPGQAAPPAAPFGQQAPAPYGQPAPAPYGQQPPGSMPPGAPQGVPQGVPATGAGLQAALQPYKETATGQRWTPQNQQLMRVDLTMGGAGVLARQGSMVMYQGKVDFGYKSAGFVGRAVGNATGQEMQLMRCTGRGQVFLAEEGSHLHPVELQGDGICVSAENVLAFDESLQYEVRRVEGHGIPGGALFTMLFQGTGTVVVKTHGTPVVLPVTPTTFADCNAVVAWSSASQVIVSSQVRLRRNAYPGHSGETVNLQFRGAPGNFIVVQPYEV
ncbi:AIM24 family protein [Streptomyces parvus]|uniref:AIM24 family protein n=1 Tax=Streptomyces parvus TaxID=66428 RepID=UPI0021CD1454